MGQTHSLSTSLSSIEEENIQKRLDWFYGGSDPKVMNQRPPKINVIKEEPKKNTSLLKFKTLSGESLIDSAGKKLTPSFIETKKRWMKHRFKLNLTDLNWASVESSDRVEDLVETYLEKNEIVRDLDNLPFKGTITGDYWSGDYWSMNLGLTSYRYSSGKEFKLYKSAVSSYFQPNEWLEFFKGFSLDKLAKEVELWSPSEKYDLAVGDDHFNLTLEQKGEGSTVVNSNGQVEGWFGICDGWSPASVLVPTPKNKIKSIGLNGVEITWYPDDIRALASLAWTNGDYSHNFIGRRCDSLKPKLYKNGRISEADCIDTNPATFHLALGNLIGARGIPFIMDATFDAEVWNQPILAYEFKYFNPLNPKQRSQNWKQVMIPYDDLFKQRDRFQHPLTRGYSRENKYFDGRVKAIVGVQATVVYLGEYRAKFSLQPQDNVIERVTYIYDLELHEKENELVPMGGEWHENTHPDFLWVPQRGAIASKKWDSGSPKINLSVLPNQELSDSAKKASKEGYPLCSVIEALVNASSEGAAYHCSQ